MISTRDLGKEMEESHRSMRLMLEWIDGRKDFDPYLADRFRETVIRNHGLTVENITLQRQYDSMLAALSTASMFRSIPPIVFDKEPVQAK